MDRLSEFLDVGKHQIGCFSGRRKKLTGAVDVALMQSLARKGQVDDRVGDYGFVIVDECHHVPARSFELVTSRAKAKYVTGLTATIARKDGHHPIVFLHWRPDPPPAPNDRRRASERRFLVVSSSGLLASVLLASRTATRGRSSSVFAVS